MRRVANVENAPAERQAAPKPARTPAGCRSIYSWDGGFQ
jgi:hypothetical protein